MFYLNINSVFHFNGRLDVADNYEYVGGIEITKVIDRDRLSIIELNTLMSKVMYLMLNAIGI